MDRPSRIPLFPLDVVLLPSMTLPLHIFEPRYKLMIRRCLDEQIEFGMVLANEKAVARVGCTAKIIRKVKDYADGRMDVLTLGCQVFALREVIEEHEYYEGRVEYLADEPLQLDRDQERRVSDLFQQCHALMFGQAWVDEEEKDPGTLAYRMAARLPMELKQRQNLLELRDEIERRKSLLKWLTEFLPKLAEREKTRVRAKGNGHGAN
ncbi:MAG TPA: LON peptidase substrate-binding domain-containing protein [Candidatus Acidoferrales bacterium]|jgi:Lon protease-like protein|nr:LON peptidase substrate-binding domain-containing protein [Candidatus Acidoferrales bacterium]